MGLASTTETCARFILQTPRNDGYAGLNKDVWLSVFSTFDFPEVLQLAEVCPQWQEWVYILTGLHLCIGSILGIRRFPRPITVRLVRLDFAYSLEFTCRFSTS